MSKVHLRSLSPHDRHPIEQLVVATRAFNAEEEAVALELVDEALAKGEGSGYYFRVAAFEGKVVGYTCYGPTPLTEGVYDLYWIAVDPELQGRGVGRELLRGAEADVRQRGGRMILIETAGKPSYAATRAFYERSDYREVARLPDYYAVGDDKVFYMRRVN
jgi:D-alanine-D-alanine ligase